MADDEEKWAAVRQALSELAEGHVLGFVVVAKVLADADGEVEQHTLISDDVTVWEALGMLRMATMVTESKVDRG